MTLLSVGFPYCLLRGVGLGSLVVSVHVEHPPCPSPVFVLVSNNCLEMGLSLKFRVL